MEELLKKYDKIFSELHGGGNARRLVEIFRAELTGEIKIQNCDHSDYEPEKVNGKYKCRKCPYLMG